MEDYYNTLLEHLDGYTVMGLFDGKRNINDIVTLQTGSQGRVFFFDQEPMIKGVDDELWDYIFQEPTVFANSELDSADKDYVKSRYPNFIDWYYFANALVSREWFSAQRYNYAGWTDHKQTVLDCNLITGSRQYRVYLAYHMFRRNYQKNSYISFDGSANWKKDLENYDYFDILSKPQKYIDRLPKEKVSYDNWGSENKKYNGLMQSRIPLEYYSQVNYITVSETLFSENKKHLSEKIFKPIAAGKPFILAAGVNNLQYLKNYGFGTFDQLWNENYDNIVDPKGRLEKIFNLIDYDLHTRKNRDSTDDYSVDFEKIKMFEQAHSIAIKNREYFWSDRFYNLIINEAVDNLEAAKLELASKRV
jgi:hypothetical protein